MKTRARSRVIGRIATVVQLVALSVFAGSSGISFLQPVQAASATTGSLLKTVSLPAASPCASGGSILSLVAGRLLGVNFAIYPVLLAVGCPTSTTISFLDPNSAGASDPKTGATAVATVTTSATNAPTSGWQAFAVRPDQGDLMACGTVSVSSGGFTYLQAQVSTIQISAPNTTVTPTTLFTTAVSGGLGNCDGLAWDASDKSVFLAPTGSSPIYHLSAAGVAANPASFSGPFACQSTLQGLMVGGSSLFVTCSLSSSVYQVKKTDGSAVTSFNPTNSLGTGVTVDGMACDPVTFAAMPNSAVWARDTTANQVYAYALPEFQCGVLIGGIVAPFGAQCDAGWSGGVTDTTSTAGDGLLDCWKQDGIFLSGGSTPDYKLPNAHLKEKDIYLELDSYAAYVPPGQSIANLVAAFKNAPVVNPDGTPGINLHVEQFTLPSAVTGPLALTPCTAAAVSGSQDFDALKRQYFGSSASPAITSAYALAARGFVFHYAISASGLQGLGTTSGCSELPGNDFAIALGGWSLSPSDLVQSWAGTIMHELGHNLNLRHGGGNGIDVAADGVTLLSANCKPNYLSVMSYAFQMPDRPVPLANWKLDYSRVQLPTLKEGSSTTPSLDESVGVIGALTPGTLNTYYTAYGLPSKTGGTQLLVPSASAAINWDADRTVPPYQIVTDNLNNFGIGTGCDGSGATLSGYNDWANLLYAFQTTIDFDDGIHTADTVTDATTGTLEITQEQSTAILTNTTPLITLTKVGPASAPVGAKISYTLTATNVGPKDATNVSIVDTLPAGVNYNSSSVCAQKSGLAVCSVGTLPTGQSATFTVAMSTTQCCVVINQAAVTSDPDTTHFQSNVIATTTLSYPWTGFFSPVANPLVLNEVNAGSSIPLKFSLGGNLGMNIFASGYPQQGTISCTTLQPNDGMATIPSDEVSLIFIIGASQYNLNIATPMSWAGTCRQIAVGLNDGTAPHLAYFRFK